MVQDEHAARVEVQPGLARLLHDPELQQEFGQDNLHLVHGKSHPDADPGSGAEGVIGYLVRGGPTVQETIRVEYLCVLTIEFLKSLE